MLKKTIIFAAVAGLIFALAPAAQAVDITLYTEHFVGDAHAQALDASPVGWTSGTGDKQRVGTATGWGCTAPPDGDDWWMAKDHWGSSAFALTHEYTVLSADRQGLKFLVDWASDISSPSSAISGMAFVAEVGGNWYRSEPLATVAGEHGVMPGEYSVSQWLADTTVSETDNWYKWISSLPMPDWGSQRTDWDEANPTPLPGGDITGFGIWLEKDGGYVGGGSFRAVDNYRITKIPEPATMALLGLGGLGLLLRRRSRKA